VQSDEPERVDPYFGKLCFEGDIDIHWRTRKIALVANVLNATNSGKREAQILLQFGSGDWVVCQG
jgi:hypothetical protein